MRNRSSGINPIIAQQERLIQQRTANKAEEFKKIELQSSLIISQAESAKKDTNEWSNIVDKLKKEAEELKVSASLSLKMKEEIEVNINQLNFTLKDIEKKVKVALLEYGCFLDNIKKDKEYITTEIDTIVNIKELEANNLFKLMQDIETNRIENSNLQANNMILRQDGDALEEQRQILRQELLAIKEQISYGNAQQQEIMTQVRDRIATLGTINQIIDKQNG